jgi:AraC-like DNA-binding protein
VVLIRKLKTPGAKSAAILPGNGECVSLNRLPNCQPLLNGYADFAAHANDELVKILLKFIKILDTVNASFFPHDEESLHDLCEREIAEQLRLADEQKTVLQVPQLRDHVMEHPGLHFHFNPDLIIGLKGTSRVQFIHEEFHIGPHALALIPGGIPHRETSVPGGNPRFENLVISVYNETVSMQHQVGRAGHLETATEFYDTSKFQLLAEYLEELAELNHEADAHRRLAIKGLLLIYFSTLASVVRRAQHSAPVEKQKISQARRLVHEHLGNPNLSVKFLAESLHCSSDYLSNLYHIETGERLIAYINKERIKAAMAMLRTTPLTVAEVAYAVGFESQGYFSRVFRHITLKSPVGYRKSLEHSVVELEGRPRTIYAGGSL